VSDPEDHIEPIEPRGRDRLRQAFVLVAETLAALLFPDRGAPPLITAGRFRLAMAIVVGAALLAAAAAGARLDIGPTIRAENAAAMAKALAGTSAPTDEPIEEKTDREIDEEIARRTAVIQVKLGLAAALWTPARILLLALGLFLLGGYVGGKPSFVRALAAAAIGALPWAVRSLIAAGAALRQDAVAPSDLPGLVAGLPLTLDHPLAERLFAGADLFSLWSVVLCGFGLAAAAGISRTRSFISVATGYALVLLITMVGTR
jgi:hypothetical protein